MKWENKRSIEEFLDRITDFRRSIVDFRRNAVGEDFRWHDLLAWTFCWRDTLLAEDTPLVLRCARSPVFKLLVPEMKKWR